MSAYTPREHPLAAQGKIYFLLSATDCAIPAYAARSDKRQVVAADARELHDIHNGFPVLHRLSDSCIQQNNGSAEHQDDRQSRTENQLHSNCPGSYRVHSAEHSCKHSAVCILRERCLSDNAIYRTLFHCNTQIVAAQRLQPTNETQICKPRRLYQFETVKAAQYI